MPSWRRAHRFPMPFAAALVDELPMLNVRHLFRCFCLFLFADMTLGLLLGQFPADVLASDAGAKKERAADFFVATNGSDRWSGQLDQPNQTSTDGPFATLARARDAVRALKQHGDKQDILVLIRGGKYQLAETVVFSLDDSAPVGGTITYAAFGNETPIFTSAVPITGWTKPQHPSPLLPAIARDLVWAADVPASLSNVLTLYDGSNRLTAGLVAAFCASGICRSDGPAEPHRVSPGSDEELAGPRQWGTSRDSLLRL